MSYYLYIHNIYLYQYHDTKPNPINIDWLLGLTPTLLCNPYLKTASKCTFATVSATLEPNSRKFFRKNCDP